MADEVGVLVAVRRQHRFDAPEKLLAVVHFGHKPRCDDRDIDEENLCRFTLWPLLQNCTDDMDVR